MKPNRIPLFPLDVVLLPAMALPLHIFEARYKLMIGRCLDERIEFGIVCAEGKAVTSVGCTAEILKKVKEYPDGRMDILAVGRSVYRPREVLQEKEYYEGMVEYLKDNEAPQRYAQKEARFGREVRKKKRASNLDAAKRNRNNAKLLPEPMAAISYSGERSLPVASLFSRRRSADLTHLLY
jgi:Lon protease-like protein